MKIFLSWSGDRSKQVANFLKSWLPKIVQIWEPWISTHNIDGGDAWFQSLDNNLGDTNLGIICLTPENVNKPWINYEAGALRKGVTSARIPVLLIDLQSNDFNTPLSSINHVLPSKADMLKMILMFLSKTQSSIKEEIVKSSFEVFWPEFDDFYNNLLNQQHPDVQIKRDDSSLIDEILTRVKTINSQLDRTTITNNPTYSITFLCIRDTSELTLKHPILSFLPDFLKSETGFTTIRSFNKTSLLIYTPLPVDNAYLHGKLNEEFLQRGIPENSMRIEIIYSNKQY